MEPDPPVDYVDGLHECWECGADHRLMPYPVEDGWVAATVCCCRAKGGLPRRYSTESEVLTTFDAAEVAISWLLHPPHVTPTEPDRERNVFWHKATGKWTVRVKRNKIAYTVGYFSDHAEAVKARDEFLTEELEAA